MRKLQTGTVTVLIVVLAGCSWLAAPQERPTDITAAGISPVGAQGPVWLAAPRPGLSAVGKDYLFVGPMTVNRDGVRRSYLWFALSTTVDRRLTGAPQPEPDSVVLVVAGTPMTFDIVPWDNGAASTPYPPAIASYRSYAARVTASQLRQLAGADDLAAYVTDAHGRSPLYSLVQGDPGDWAPLASP